VVEHEFGRLTGGVLMRVGGYRGSAGPERESGNECGGN
jgi:hypothetical protein